MAPAFDRFEPDYADPPGWILEEHLEVEGISQAEFARRCGRSPKLISEIIAGKAPIEPETALQFERVLGLRAHIWLGIERDYRLRLARMARAEKEPAAREWAKAFPVRELERRGCFQSAEYEADAASKLLAFFQVASVEAWTVLCERRKVAYRHSPKFKSNGFALAAWLRLGEIEAERQECAEFGKERFKLAVGAIRGLTREPVDEALREATRQCNEAGVALALVRALPRTALSGAARWLSPEKAVIQLTARHKTGDHLWFSFFHEAAHILLHSRKGIYVDDVNGTGAEQEEEANAWAADMLVPRADREKFFATGPRLAQQVEAFADEQGIAPGIVVGMLQHRRLLPWSHLNDLKVPISPEALESARN